MSKQKLTRNQRAFILNPKSFIKENAIVPLDIVIKDSTGATQTISIDPRTEQFLDQQLNSGGSVTVRPRHVPGTDIP